MLGEHPELYGFPELHVFVGDTVQEVIDFEKSNNKRHAAGPPGLLRTLAQIHDGVQTNGTRASRYRLAERATRLVHQEIDGPSARGGLSEVGRREESGYREVADLPRASLHVLSRRLLPSLDPAPCS